MLGLLHLVTFDPMCKVHERFQGFKALVFVQSNLVNSYGLQVLFRSIENSNYREVDIKYR